MLSDHGMIVVLILLCIVLSAATYAEQSPTGASAGRQLAAKITSEFKNAPHVLIAVRDVPEDASLAEALDRDLTKSGAKVLAVVRGEPKDARQAIEAIIVSGNNLDAIACTQETGGWLVFADLKTDFPKLGGPRIVTPPSYSWPTFLTSSNLLNIANQVAVIAIMAIGMTLVIVTGGIDLSVGSLLALSAVLTAKFIRDAMGGMEASPLGMTVACLGAISLCALVGAFSGAMITRIGLPPFIVTLAMMLVGRGLAYRVSNNQSIYEIPDSFMWLGRGADLFGLPNAVVLMLALYALAHVLMSRTRLGRYLYAVGGNREAARLSGVPVERIAIFAYVASAILAALGGVIMASQYKSGSGTYGDMYELYVIAAVVVGGAPIAGGEGKMFGTLTGAFTIAVIQNGMNLTHIESQTQRIVLGFVILAAVLIGKVRRS